jgi:hypothetical protein
MLVPAGYKEQATDEMFEEARNPLKIGFEKKVLIEIQLVQTMLDG